jgi:hypothetical protein
MHRLGKMSQAVGVSPAACFDIHQQNADLLICIFVFASRA